MGTPVSWFFGLLQQLLLDGLFKRPVSINLVRRPDGSVDLKTNINPSGQPPPQQPPTYGYPPPIYPYAYPPPMPPPHGVHPQAPAPQPPPAAGPTPPPDASSVDLPEDFSR